MPHITACQLVKYLSFIFLKVHTYFVGAFITSGLQNDTGPRKEIAVPPTLSQEEKMLAPLQSFDLSAQAQCSSLKNTKQGIQEEEGHDTDGLKLQECHKFHEVHEAEVTASSL
jgi:hypothetical protein